MPDGSIVAKEGAGNAPAYRGLAYVVFERLPRANFGNRIPQLSFEIIRPIGLLEQMVRAVTLIPGTTEFGYETSTVVQLLVPDNRRRRTAITARRDPMWWRRWTICRGCARTCNGWQWWWRGSGPIYALNTAPCGRASTIPRRRLARCLGPSLASRAPLHMPFRKSADARHVTARSIDPDVLTRLAVFANPWPGSVVVWQSKDGASFQVAAVAATPAVIGETLDPLPAAPSVGLPPVIASPPLAPELPTAKPTNLFAFIAALVAAFRRT